MPFFVIFIVIPFLEIMVFMSVGEKIGLPTTLLLALFTAVLGGFLVKSQGLKTIRDMQIALRSGHMPLNELFDGICLIIAGATLITPGFVTDTIGFLLLIPYVRTLIKTYIRKNTNFHAEMGSSLKQDPNVIEAEYQRVDDDQPQDHKP